MKKWVVGLVTGLGVAVFSLPAFATGVFRDLRDDKDTACVISCLEAKSQCSAADRIKCQADCRRPVPTITVIGNAVFEGDLDPAKEYQLVQAYARQQGHEEGKTQILVTTYTANPLEDLGIDLPLFSYIHILPIDVVGPSDEGVETVVYADRISCTWAKNAPLPFGGGFGAGCRETPKNGTAGWAAIGCFQSNGCCYKPGLDGTVGAGVCTVNSTEPGDGFY